MKKSSIFKLFNQLPLLLFIFLKVKSSCFDDPKDTCVCKKAAVNSSGQCVDQCRSYEVMVDFIPKKSFKRCVKSSETKLFLKQSDDRCENTCPEGEINLDGVCKCLKSFEDCPNDYFRSEQRQLCAKQCQPRTEGDVIVEKPIIDQSTQIKSCVIECPYTKKFKLNGKCSSCFDSDQRYVQNEITSNCENYMHCDGYFSDARKYCWKDSCKKNEYLRIGQEKVNWPNTKFQCFACQQQTPFLSSNRKSCVKECGPNEFTDKYNSQCLANIEDCTDYLSSDRKTCSYRCQKGEIPMKRKKGQSYIECQKCPNEKPFVDNTLTTCVDQCKPSEILQEYYNTCLSQESDCTQDFEFQVLTKDLKRCSVQCPKDYGVKKFSFFEINYECNKCSDGKFVNIIQTCEFQCKFPNIYDTEKKECILCFGFVLNNQCLERCPVNMFYTSTYSYGYSQYDLIYERRECVDSCGWGAYEQIDSNECRYSCNEGELTVSKLKCIKKEDCAIFITSDQRYCVDHCYDHEYLVQKNGQLFCQLCQDIYIQAISSQSPGQCVKQCPKSLPYIIIKNNQKTCATASDCKDLLISSSGNYCTENCLLSDFLEVNFKRKCVSQCSPDKQIIKYHSDDGFFECKETCLGFMSSDSKLCINECKDLFEVENDSYMCTKCNEGEYLTYNSTQKKTICVHAKNDFNELNFRLDNLQSLFNKGLKILIKQEFDFFVEQFQAILRAFELGFIQRKVLNKFYDIVFDMSYCLKGDYRFQSNVFKTNQTRLITQNLEKNYNRQYNLTYSLAGLKNDHPDLTSPNLDIGSVPQFNPISLLVIVSQKNFLCPEIISPLECFHNIETIIIKKQVQNYNPQYEDDYQQDQPTIYKILFNVEDKNKNLSQYVCLSTIQKRMYRSVKTEILLDQKGIVCTFINNVTLFYDSKNEFMECPQNLPYKIKDQCVEKCPKLLDPSRQLCVDSIKQCIFISRDGRSCLPGCAGYMWKQKSTKNQITCFGDYFIHTNQLITYNDDTYCFETRNYHSCSDQVIILSNKNECKFYLIDDQECSLVCPEGKFVSQSEELPYRLCLSEDPLIKKKIIQSKDEPPKYFIYLIICIIIIVIIFYIKQKQNSNSTLLQTNNQDLNQQQNSIELVQYNQRTQLLTDYDQSNQQR